jgi:hypothetical protein
MGKDEGMGKKSCGKCKKKWEWGRRRELDFSVKCIVAPVQVGGD